MTNKTLQSNKVDRDSTQLINFKQRRITNAAPAVNKNDYVTLDQLLNYLQNYQLITPTIPTQPKAASGASTVSCLDCIWVTAPASLTLTTGSPSAYPADYIQYSQGADISLGSNGTYTDRLIFNKDGVYLAGYNIWLGTASGAWQGWMEVNGSGATVQASTFAQIVSTSSNQFVLAASAPILAVKNDYVQFMIEQTTGGNQAIGPGSGNLFAGFWAIGPF